MWLTTPVHISRHLSYVAGGFVIGVALAPDWPWTHVGKWVGVTALSFWLGMTVWTRRRGLLALALIAGGMVGLVWGGQEHAAFQKYAPYVGSAVRVRGMVAEDTSHTNKGDTRIMLRSIQLEGNTMRGTMWLSTRTQQVIKRGDVIVVHGVLQEGFGALPASMPRAIVVAVDRPYPGDVARRVRDWFTTAIQKAIPGPESLLGMGYLTGQRSTLPESLDEQLRIAGLTHAVVASGYNLTILVAFARQAFLRASKYTATMAASIMIAGFVLVTGFSPSMSRAGLVTAMSLAAWYYGRVIRPGVLLPVAAAITLLINPSYIWGDFGWYLSFLAFIGITVVAPVLRGYLWGATAEPPMVPLLIMETVAAQLVTMPVILFGFGQYASFALLANVLVLPLVPLAMLLTFLSGVGSLILPVWAYAWGLPAYAVLHYMVGVVHWVANLPGAQHEIHFGVAWLMASYSFLAYGMWVLHRRAGGSYGKKDEVLK